MAWAVLPLPEVTSDDVVLEPSLDGCVLDAEVLPLEAAEGPVVWVPARGWLSATMAPVAASEVASGSADEGDPESRDPARRRARSLRSGGRL